MKKIILSIFLLISCTPINQNTNNTNSSPSVQSTPKPTTSINPSQTPKPSETPINTLKKFVLSDTIQLECAPQVIPSARNIKICVGSPPQCTVLRFPPPPSPDPWEQEWFRELPPKDLNKALFVLTFYDELGARYNKITKTFYSKNGYDMSDYNQWLKDYNVESVNDISWLKTEEEALKFEKEKEYQLCKDYPNEYSNYRIIIRNSNIYEFFNKLLKDTRVRQIFYSEIDLQGLPPGGVTINKVLVYGKVFDRLGKPIDNVDINIKLLDPNTKFDDGSTSLSTKTTSQGYYVLKDVPISTRVELKATKEGWTTQSRIEYVRSNLAGNPDINTFNLGVEGQTNSQYSIQDEPQIESVKVNGTKLDKFGSNYAGRPTDSMTGSVTSLKPELIFEFMFTEPVNKESFQNAFRIDSKSTLSGRVPKEFTLTGAEFDWTWSDDNKTVTLKSKKTLLQAGINNQMRYKVYLNEAFKDNNNLSAYLGAYFKFGTSTEKDYFTIALENDTTDAKLLKIENNDTGTSDQIILTFNKPFSVHDYTVPEVLLFYSYEIKKNGTVFKQKPSKIELSPDGKSLVMEWNSNSTFVKNDIISLMVLTDKLKSPSGRVFSTTDTNKVEGIDTADNLKVVKVVN